MMHERVSNGRARLLQLIGAITIGLLGGVALALAGAHGSSRPS